MISTIRNNIQRRENFDQAMTFFNIDDAGLRRELWNSLKTFEHGHTPNITQKVSRAARAKITVAERRLLELLIFDRELQDIILPQLEPSDYENVSTTEFFAAFMAAREAQQEIDIPTLFEHIGDDDTSLELARELLAGKPRREKDDVIDDVLHQAENCVFSLRNMAIANRIMEISREATLAESANDTELFNQLTFEQLELEKIRRELQRRITEL